MKNITIKPLDTIRQSMKKMNQCGEKCLVIVDETNTLLGTLSDGDIRKAILKGASVSDSIRSIYHPKPTFLVKGKFTLHEAKKLFTKNKFDLIPVVDYKGKLSDILFWDTVLNNGKSKKKEKLNVPVVIMAGGKGARLEPFTKVLPKPLVPIHEKPLIEHILKSFTDVGVSEFIVSINYKARIMRAFFEELNPSFSVDFLEESEPLGTAGSLKLLGNRFDKPFIVTNCDIIIKADYSDIFKFHIQKKYDITLVACMKNYIIPYGTCELNGEGELKSISEKPEYEFLVNTGLYVLNPELLKLIPAKKMYHITNLIADAKESGKKIGVYPIDEDSWIDVGQWEEYKKVVARL
jgi:dTDP-glucose pyrophosphorylase